MNSSKLTTAEMLELIPFRGRDLDCNYFVFCKCCEKRQRLWYRSANNEMRDRMEKGLEGKLNCPACHIKKKVTDSVIIQGKMPVDKAIHSLYMMSLSTGIDYEKAENDLSYQNRMNAELERDREKTEYLLKQFQK
jgi:hypothetical protein